MIERPYWLDTLGPSPHDNPQSPLPSAADVLVIGAGYTGLSAARRLAKSGADVTVLERDHVGAGASARNGGQVLTGLRLDPATLVHRYGEARAGELFATSLSAIEHLEELIAAESIDCEYKRCGHILAAWKSKHFDALRDEQALLARVFHHRVELVSRSAQREELASDRYHGLLIDERSAGLNPARYVLGLAAATRRAGARIVEGVGVDRVERTNGGWTVFTSAGQTTAREIVVATDGYVGRESPLLRRRMVSIGSYVVTTAPLSAAQATELLPRRRVAFDSKHFLYYFRLTADNRLLFGGRASFTVPDDTTTRRAAAVLQRGIADVFPHLAGVPIAYAWGGKVGIARDQRPHAGRLRDGTWFAGAYAGHGIAMATMLGDLVARRIAGERVSHPFMDDDCPAIPFYNGAPWFLPLVGAFYRVMDWIS